MTRNQREAVLKYLSGLVTTEGHVIYPEVVKGAIAGSSPILRDSDYIVTAGGHDPEIHTIYHAPGSMEEAWSEPPDVQRASVASRELAIPMRPAANAPQIDRSAFLRMVGKLISVELERIVISGNKLSVCDEALQTMHGMRVLAPCQVDCRKVAVPTTHQPEEPTLADLAQLRLEKVVVDMKRYLLMRKHGTPSVKLYTSPMVVRWLESRRKEKMRPIGGRIDWIHSATGPVELFNCRVGAAIAMPVERAHPPQSGPVTLVCAMPAKNFVFTLGGPITMSFAPSSDDAVVATVGFRFGGAFLDPEAIAVVSHVPEPSDIGGGCMELCPGALA